jgi:hypothetical protein
MYESIGEKFTIGLGLVGIEESVRAAHLAYHGNLPINEVTIKLYETVNSPEAAAAAVLFTGIAAVIIGYTFLNQFFVDVRKELADPAEIEPCHIPGYKK